MEDLKLKLVMNNFRSLYKELKVNVSLQDLSTGLAAVNNHSTMSSASTEALSKHLTDIDAQLKEKLLAKYADDYQAFGYDIPDFLLKL